MTKPRRSAGPTVKYRTCDACRSTLYFADLETHFAGHCPPSPENWSQAYVSESRLHAYARLYTKGEGACTKKKNRRSSAARDAVPVEAGPTATRFAESCVGRYRDLLFFFFILFRRRVRGGQRQRSRAHSRDSVVRLCARRARDRQVWVQNVGETRLAVGGHVAVKRVFLQRR